MSSGWDCHAHLFGPYERFPLAADRSYTPPEAVASQYLALLSRLGLSHGVLVHPSAYGEDFSLLFDALAQHKNLRGVIVVRPDTRQTLEGLRDIVVTIGALTFQRHKHIAAHHLPRVDDHVVDAQRGQRINAPAACSFNHICQCQHVSAEC